MRIRSKKRNVRATSDGAPNGAPSEIPTGPPQELQDDTADKSLNGVTSNDVDANDDASNGAASNGIASNGIHENGENGVNGVHNGDLAESKKSKRKNKKVSFGFEDVQEIPAREKKDPADDIDDIIENGHDIDDDDDNDGDSEGEGEREQEGKEEKIDHKNSDIEFLRKFANLRKLGNVMEERSRKQEQAERQHAESELARAREILQKQVRRQELARLIPSEELDRLLSAVNMQEEYVVSRDDERKFMLSKRGKTSFIYLAGKDEEEQVDELEPHVQLTQSEDTFSQTFVGGAEAGLL